MPALTAAVRKQAEQETLELPFPIPEKEWFSLRAAGGLLGLCESVAEKLYDKGEITGHSHNAGTGQRIHKRVHRLSLIAYAMRTADYDSQSLIESLLGSFRFLSLPLLERLARGLAQLIEAKKICPGVSVKFPRSASGS